MTQNNSGHNKSGNTKSEQDKKNEDYETFKNMYKKIKDNKDSSLNDLLEYAKLENKLKIGKDFLNPVNTPKNFEFNCSTSFFCDPEFETKQELDAIFSSIFPNKIKRDEFLRHYANVYFGNKSHKTFHIWYGKGNNGKTLLLDLFKIAFPCKTVCMSEDSNSDIIDENATQGLNFRLFVIQEVNDRITNNSLTQLFDNKTQGTILIITNSLIFPNSGMNNLESINIENYKRFDFESIFTSNCHNPDNGEFLIDYCVSEKIKANKYSEELYKLLKQYL